MLLHLRSLCHFFLKQVVEKSVLDTNIEAKAFLEVIGKKMHSEGFREPDAN